ncbi:MAG: trehalose-phosphatase [Anaerolineales bacterium]|nr:trehalose-phosphatase [Anaerolineales bacterium]
MKPWSEFNTIRFRQQLEDSKQCILLLDYDGTLAPFREAKERNLAFPYPGVRDLLAKIMNQGKTRVIIISARPVTEIVHLVGLEPSPEVWGIYGWERRLSDGTYFAPPSLDLTLVRVLREAVEWAKQNEVEWEAKPDMENPVSVAFHWRVSTDPLGRSQSDLQEMITSYTGECIKESNLLIKGGDHVQELMIPGQDKGDAVRAVLSELKSHGVVAYLGDSLGDEDAFEAIKPVGLGVLVSSQNRSTAAALHISPPEELLEFLELWTNL